MTTVLPKWLRRWVRPNWQTCQVVAVGPGGIIDGKEVVMQVKVGDKVLCSNYAGSNFKVDGKEFTILKQSDILAVVED